MLSIFGNGKSKEPAADEKTGQKKLKEQFSPRVSIRIKLELFVAVLVVIIFSTAAQMASAIHKSMEVSGNIHADYQSGGVLLLAVDAEEVTRIFDEGRRIYDSIPEEIRSDRTSPEYLAYYDGLATDKYEEILKTCREFAELYDYKWIDLRMVDEENDRNIFLLDTSGVQNGMYDIGYWEKRGETAEEYSIENDESYEESVEIETISTIMNILEISSMKIPQFCTLVPFTRPGTDEVIGYIALGEDTEIYDIHRRVFGIIFFIAMMFFLVIVLFITGLTINWLLVRPIRRLSRAARVYVTEKKDDRDGRFFENVPIKTRDEVRVLRDSMSYMEGEIESYLKDLTAMTAEKERVAAELDVAAKIQLSMLPETLEGYEGTRCFSISSSIRPAKEVGGDFYDYFPIDDDHIMICIADVSGKGVPAALFMVVVKTLLKDHTSTDVALTDIIGGINAKLCSNNAEMMFVTVWMGIYTVSEGRLDYINAGHEYPVVYRKRDDKFELIVEKHDSVLGFVPDITFTPRCITLEPGDKLYLYTDGVPEATREDSKMYGTDRMIEFLNSDTSRSGPELLEAIRSDVDTFVNGAPQFDDITMVLLEINE